MPIICKKYALTMHTYTVLVKYAKLCSENMQKYAGLYAKHAFIAYFTFICTPHFADGLMASSVPIDVPATPTLPDDTAG